MGKYNICVYAIAKDEEQFVDRWMDAVGEADQVIVVDTGSSDATVARLRARGATVYEMKFSPWRFDAARNAALDHVSEDADICVSNDLDEVFEPGWRAKLESAWDETCTRARYLFTWSYHPDGTPAKQFPMEKIHARRGFRWVHPVHEVLEYNGEKPDRSVWVAGMTLHHRPDLTKPRSQYLPLLELSVAEHPENDRAMFWLGREYFYNKRYGDCIRTLERHLRLNSAKWDEERAASMRLIAQCREELRDLREAQSWLYRAVAECPNVREGHLALAKFGYRAGNWAMTYAAVKNALAIASPSGSYLVEPESWGGAPYDYGAIAAYHLGLYAEARAFAQIACAANPDDARLKANLQRIEEKLGESEGEPCAP